MTPTAIQLDELRRYATEHGRNWKAQLLDDWTLARTSGPLQDMRNTLGPSWLLRHGAQAVRGTPGAASQAPASATSAPAVTYETVGARVYVLGQTYPIRDAIRAAGGHWDAERKAWWIGTAKRAELEAAIASAKPATADTYRPSQCKQCGRRPDRRGWPRIYRSGICSDCYRDEREEAEMGY